MLLFNIGYIDAALIVAVASIDYAATRYAARDMVTLHYVAIMLLIKIAAMPIWLYGCCRDG